MLDWVYLILAAPIVAAELWAAFGPSPRWRTITEIVQRFERRSGWARFAVAVLIALEFSHLVLNVP